MPQIEQLAATYAGQIFWLLVVFGLVYLVIGRGMVPKVMDTVGLREKQIADDLTAAQSARDAADEAEEAWRVRENANREKAQALVADAKARAQSSTEAQLAKVQSRIDVEMEQAEARIAASREKAAAQISDVAAEAAQDITKRIANIAVSEAAAKAAVQRAMAHG